MPNIPGLPETDIEVHALYDKIARICRAFPVPVMFRFADPDLLWLVTDPILPLKWQNQMLRIHIHWIRMFFLRELGYGSRFCFPKLDKWTKWRKPNLTITNFSFSVLKPFTLTLHKNADDFSQLTRSSVVWYNPKSELNPNLRNTSLVNPDTGTQFLLVYWSW